MFIRRRTLLKATAAASLGGLALRPLHAAYGQQPLVWRAFTYNTVATATATRAVTRMIDRVKTESGGHLGLDLHLGGSLPINPTTITAAVADNVIAMADDGFFTGNVPIGSLLRMPFLIASVEEFDTARQIADVYYARAFNDKGIKFLAQYTYAPPTIFSRKKLMSLADLKSQKIRTTSTVQADLIKQFGAIPITIGTAAVAAAADRGVIDGVMAAGSSVATIWRGLFRYQLDLAPAFVNSVFIVNKAAFEALPPDLQAIVETAAKDACGWATAALMTEESEAVQKMVREDHLEIGRVGQQDLAGFKADMPAYWEKWAKETGPDAVEALGKLRAAVGR